MLKLNKKPAIKAAVGAVCIVAYVALIFTYPHILIPYLLIPSFVAGVTVALFYILYMFFDNKNDDDET